MRFIFLLVLMLPLASTASGFERPEDPCLVYLQLSDEMSCSKGNYLSQFGYHYCRKYLEANEKFSETGQEFLKKNRSCLVETLLETKELSCSNVKKKAFEQHLDCYLENDFCTLPTRDIFKVFRILTPSFKDPQAIISGIRLKRHCWEIKKI